ncbi:MAG: tripartite tricarboxylate transporter substrate binding protein [Burkholderiaceae bacterium]
MEKQVHNSTDTNRRSICAALALALAGVAPGAALAQEGTPGKPIRIVVPYPPGGPLDAAARLLAEAVRPSLGNVIVENKAGAGGNIGVDYVAKQPADGMTLVVGALATHAVNPSLFSKLPFDPVKDFAPITLIAHVPNVLVMTPQTAAKYTINNARDLVEVAHKNPGKLNYASGGNGSAGHMAGELVKSQAKVSMVHIPYPGAAPAQMSLLAGQTDLMFDNLASATPQIKSGKLKALAVTTAHRAVALPELPTMAESGLPGFDISTWFGLFAPAGTPAAAITKLNAAFTAALRTPEMHERLSRMGVEPAPTTPQQLADLVASEIPKYRTIVKFSGAKVD